MRRHTGEHKKTHAPRLISHADSALFQLNRVWPENGRTTDEFGVKPDPWNSGPALDQSRFVSLGSENAAQIKLAKKASESASGAKKASQGSIAPYRTGQECALANMTVDWVGRCPVMSPNLTQTGKGHTRPRAPGTPKFTPSRALASSPMVKSFHKQKAEYTSKLGSPTNMTNADRLSKWRQSRQSAPVAAQPDSTIAAGKAEEPDLLSLMDSTSPATSPGPTLGPKKVRSANQYMDNEGCMFDIELWEKIQAVTADENFVSDLFAFLMVDESRASIVGFATTNVKFTTVRVSISARDFRAAQSSISLYTQFNERFEASKDNQGFPHLAVGAQMVHNVNLVEEND